jgi:hypothetical protein
LISGDRIGATGSSDIKYAPLLTESPGKTVNLPAQTH